MPFCNKFGNFENLHCGLIFIIKGNPLPVPLKHVDIEAKIIDFMSQVTITQKYVNSETSPIEVFYSYPIEESAAVVAFDANIDGHEIEAEVKEKNQAMDDYDQAIKCGNSAILLEETAPDIFSMKLGQLKAGAGATIRLSYIMELPMEDYTIRMTIPTTIAPRYIPPRDNSKTAQDIAKITYNDEDHKSIPLSVFINMFMKGQIMKVHSPSHDIKTSISMKNNNEGIGQHFEAKSELSAVTDIMNRDLVVEIELMENESMFKPIILVEEINQDCNVAMVSMIPRVFTKSEDEEQKCELIFLIDRSGSMGGSSIVQAIQALQLFLHSLPSDCYFNIWSFGSRFSSLFPESEYYNDDSLRQALNHVSKIRADYGGTEIYQPLQAIFQQKPIPHYNRNIILLTDGNVSNGHQIIQLVKNHSSKNRIFSLGLGSSASRNLVKGVARAGNGRAVFSTLKEDLRLKVMTLLKNALSAVSQVKVIWNFEKKEEEIDLIGKKTALNKSEQFRKNTGYLGKLFYLAKFHIFSKLNLNYYILYWEIKKASKDITDNQLLCPTDLRDDSTKNNCLESARSNQESTENCFDASRIIMYKFFESKFKLKSVVVTAKSSNGLMDFETGIGQDCYLKDNGIFLHQMAARKEIQKLQEFYDPQCPCRIQPCHDPACLLDRRESCEESIRCLALSYGMASKFTSFVGVDKKTRKSVFDTAMVTREVRQEIPVDYGCSLFDDASDVDEEENIKGGAGNMMGAMGGALKGGFASDPCKKVFDCDMENDDWIDMLEKDGKPSNTKNSMKSDNESPDGDALLNLIHLQSADGSFKFGQAFEVMMKLDYEKIQAKCPENIEMEVWVTAIAVALLEKKFASDKYLWELIAHKSIIYLKKHTSTPIYIIRDASELF